MIEEWRDIAGYPSYQVSNLGRVKSFQQGKTMILQPELTNNGYLRVRLYKDGKAKRFSVHRLVATAFISNPDGKPQVNHRDGHPLNNHVSNLEWATAHENMRHAYETGLVKKTEPGESHPSAKLSNEQAAQIRQNPNNLTGRQLAKKFGVDARTISNLQLGKTYGNVGGKIREAKIQRVPDDVREKIRAEYKRGVRGYSQPALAKKYGVDSSTICRIIHE